jgi:hypothetical protein
MPQNQPDSNQPLNTSDLLQVLNHPSFLKLGVSDQRTVLGGLTNRPEFDQMNDADTFKFMSAVRSSQPTQYEQQQSQQASQLRSVPGMATDALPIIGGIAGGAAGLASPIPGGAMIGGGLGAAGGEQLREHIMRLGGGDATNPASKQGLMNTGRAAALGAGGEAPAAAMAAIGRRAEGKIAADEFSRLTANETSATDTANINRTMTYQKLSQQPRPAWEQGNVAQALSRVMPEAKTVSTMTKDFKTDNVMLSRALTKALNNSTEIAPVDKMIEPIQREAQMLDQQKPGSSMYMDWAINRAKTLSGITGPTATTQQLYTFQQKLGAFTDKADPELQSMLKKFGVDDPSTVVEFTQPLKNRAAGAISQQVKSMLGQDGRILENMQNNYAAIKALKTFNMPTDQLTPIKLSKGYEPGWASQRGITIKNNPWKSAIASPAAVVGATFAPDAISSAKSKVKSAVGSLVP